MNYSEMMEALATLQNMPVAYVMSTAAHQRIAAERARRGAFPGEPTQGPRFMGTPLYPFEDVPAEEVTIFKDRDAFLRYLRLREKLGHGAALKRLMADVDPSLVQQATVRALLEVS